MMQQYMQDVADDVVSADYSTALDSVVAKDAWCSICSAAMRKITQIYSLTHEQGLMLCWTMNELALIVCGHSCVCTLHHSCAGHITVRTDALDG